MLVFDKSDVKKDLYYTVIDFKIFDTIIYGSVLAIKNHNIKLADPSGQSNSA